MSCTRVSYYKYFLYTHQHKNIFFNQSLILSVTSWVSIFQKNSKIKFVFYCPERSNNRFFEVNSKPNYRTGVTCPMTEHHLWPNILLMSSSSLLHFEWFKTLWERQLELFNSSLNSRSKGVIIEEQEETYTFFQVIKRVFLSLFFSSTPPTFNAHNFLISCSI